jgi:dihydropteroate synthase
MKTYLRPTALVHGTDARRMIETGTAAPLAGRADLAFAAAEWIERSGATITRRMVSLNEARSHPAFDAATAPRRDFGPVSLSRCHVMGIVNVTPDSFSDGGLHNMEANAIAQAKRLAAEGATILDIGGESTRPGAVDVEFEEESARVLPVVKALSAFHCLSIDTRKASLMREGLGAGAAIINDVSALQYDADSLAVIASAKAPVILMHAQGDPATMQKAPHYQDVALDVYDQLAALMARAEAAGIARHNIMLDPGIGFGKTFAQNLELLQQLSLFHGLGAGLLVGLSRKGFIGAVTGEKTAWKRLGGSVGGALAAAQQGAQILRVHDVKETFTALQVLNAAQAPDSVTI